jgi:hypothetical protein
MMTLTKDESEMGGCSFSGTVLRGIVLEGFIFPSGDTE